MIRSTLSTVLTVALLALVGATASAALHFDLDRSQPEAGATVDAVDAVDLWFTEAPQEGTTTIRLVGAGGELVPTADVSRDPDDDTHFSVAVQGPVAPGSYTVAWRGMGQDGHVVRDEFGFTVAGR